MWSRTRRPAGQSNRPAHLRFVVESLEDRLVPDAFTPGDLAVFVAASNTATNTTATIAELSPTTAGQSPTNVISIDGTGGTALRFSGSAANTGYLSHSDDGTLLSFAGANSTDTTTNTNALNPRGVGTLDASGTFALQTTYTGTSGSQSRSATSLDDSTWFIADQGGLYTNGASAASPVGNLRAVKSFGGAVYVGQQSGATTTLQVATVSAASGGTITGLPGLTNNVSFQDFYLIRSGDNGSTFDVLYITSASNPSTGTIDKYSLVDSDSNGSLDSWVANGTYATNFGGFGIAAADNGNGALLYVTTGTGNTVNNNVIKLEDAAGYNATISITTANNVTLYAAGSSATIKGIDFAPVAPPPANSAPVLSGANDFAAINEDDAANTGTPVSALISGKVTDADAGALAGIAVTATNTANGTWQYTTDGGSHWTDMGSVSDSSALLLAADANTRLRFVPVADFSGTVSPGVTFRAWDQTGGAAGTKADASSNGGATAFSAATASSAITVNFVDDAPVLSLPGGAVSYTENGSPVVLDGGATVTDVDNGTFDSGKLTVDFASGGTADDRLAIRNEGAATGQIGVSGSAVTYEGTIIGSFTGGAGTTALVVSLNGSATTAAVQALLRNVTFANASDDPAAAARTVRFALDDGLGGTSSPVTKTVTVSAVNDAPVNHVPPDQTANQDVALVFSSAKGNAISVSDVDAGAAAIKVTLTAGHGTVTLSGAAGLTFSDGDGTADATTTFTGSISDINTALEGLTFTPDAGFTGPASLKIDTDDQGNGGSGGAQTDSDTVGVTVNAVNAPPTLTATPANPTFTEDGPAVALFGGAAASTVEAGQTITRIVLTVGVTGGAAEQLLIDGTAFSLTDGTAGTTATNALGVSVSVSGATATVTISKAAGISAPTTEVVVNGLAYQNTSQDPTGGPRAVTLTSVTDDGGTANGGRDTTTLSITSTVTVVPVNDAPTLTAAANNPTYTEGSPGVALFITASASTVEAGQTVTQLKLTVSNVADDAEILGVDGLDVALTDGTSVGGRIAVSVTGTTATVTISSAPGLTPAQVEALVAGMSYRNSSQNPTPGARTVTLTSVADDGGTANGGQDTTTLSVASAVTVVAVNDAPVNHVPGDQTTDEDTPLAFSTGKGNAISVSDVDAGTASVKVTLTASHGTAKLAGTTGLAVTGDGSALVTLTGSIGDINAALDGLTFTPDADFNGSASLQVLTDDQGNGGSGGAQTDSDTINITVNAVNDSPTFDVAGDITIDEGIGAQSVGGFASNFQPGPATAADEAAQTLTGYAVAVTGTTGSLTFASAPAIGAGGALTFEAAGDTFGTATVRVAATDSGGATSDPRTFTITVNPVADTPTATDATTDEDSQTAGGLVVTRSPVDGSEVGYFRVANVQHGTVYLADGVTVVNDGDFVAFDSTGSAQLRFTPDADQNDATGTFGFGVQASVGAGAAGLGGAVVPVAVHVSPVDDAPAVALAKSAVSVPQDSGAFSLAHFATFQTGGGPDEAGQTPTYHVAVGNPSLFGVQPTIDAAGRLRFTPGPGASGSTVVSVAVTDSDGATSAPAQKFTVAVVAAVKLPPEVPPVNSFTPAVVAVGSGAGEPGRVRVLDAVSGGVLSEFVPFGGFTGGVAVAVGDVNGDSRPDVIVATATGASHVKVFSASGAEMMSFLAFPGFTGGLSVAAGDIDRDGRADIVVGTATGSSHVKVFGGATGAEIRSFMAFPGFAGGVRVAAGDVDGDGADDVAAVAGPGGNGHVKVFGAGTGQLLTSFLGYEGYLGEINLAVADVTGDGRAEVITAAQNPAMGAHVKAFTAQARVVRSFFAPTGAGAAMGFARMTGTPAPVAGAPRVAAAEASGDHVADILLGTVSGGGDRLLTIDGATGATLRNQLAFDPLSIFGVYVG